MGGDWSLTSTSVRALVTPACRSSRKGSNRSSLEIERVPIVLSPCLMVFPPDAQQVWHTTHGFVGDCISAFLFSSQVAVSITGAGYQSGAVRSLPQSCHLAQDRSGVVTQSGNTCGHIPGRRKRAPGQDTQELFLLRIMLQHVSDKLIIGLV
jgi:hypothetical protein